LAGLKLSTIINKENVQISNIEWLYYFAKGRLISSIIPQGGNLHNALVLKKEYNIKYSKFASDFLTFAWLDIIINLLICALILIVINPTFSMGSLNLLKITIIFIILLIIAPFLFDILIKKFSIRNEILKYKFILIFEVIVNNVVKIKGYPNIIIKNLLYSFLTFSSNVLIVIMTYASLNQSITLEAGSMFAAIIKIGSLIQVVPGNIGIMEFAYGFLANKINISINTGILVSMIIRISGFISLLFLLIFIKVSLNIKKKYHRDIDHIIV
jgi:uncharacterized membrane protein YbhN (UPF0104 family)